MTISKYAHETSCQQLIFMNQEEKIEKAKWSGLCLTTLLASVIFLAWAIWTDTNFFVLILALTAFTYTLYQALIMDAYPLFSYALQKYWKCNRLHSFFESKRKIQKHDKIWGLASENSSQQLQNDQPYHENQLSISRLENSRKLEESSSKKESVNSRLFLNRKKQNQGRTNYQIGEIGKGKAVKTEQFESARRLYKQTIQQFASKGIKREWLQQIYMLAKTEYSRKVLQLLSMSQENQKAIISIIQQRYEVKVMLEADKLPEKIEPVSLDEVIERVRRLSFTKGLPWNERKSEDTGKGKSMETLQEMAVLRQKIDSIISPLISLNHKKREQLVRKLRSQVQELIPADKNLLYVLISMFNQNIKNEEYKLMMKAWEESSKGIEVVECWIGQRFHANLKKVKGDKTDFYYVNPGEDNFWCLLGIASQISKHKL